MTASLRYFSLSSSFARPADAIAYAPGDLVANDIDAGDVVPLSWQIPGNLAVEPVAVRLRKTDELLTNASFKVHLFSSAPTLETAGDNGLLTADVSGSANWLASFSGTLANAFKDGACGLLVPDSLNTIVPIFQTPGSPVKGIIEATAAYAPTSGETFTATLICRMPF